MKILFISREYPPETGWGGIGSYIVSVAPGLTKRGHDVHVLSCVEGQPNSDYTDRGTSIHRRGQMKLPLAARIRRPSWLPFTAERFQTGISMYYEYRRLGMDFDVIEYPDWGAEGWLMAMLHKKPTVCTLHTPLPVICYYASIPMCRDKKWASRLEHYAVRHADVRISPSEVLVRELRGLGWVNGHDVEVIHNPIDFEQWASAGPVRNTGPVVLFLSQLYVLKAPELLVEAMAIIRKDIPDARALFIGGSSKRDGLWYAEWIKTSCSDTTGCEFIGKIPRHEALRYISASRVFALPARFDNFSMAALELMAAGRPVVIAERSGVADLLKKTGGGRVVPGDDPVALAEALRPFLEDASYASATGEMARAAVREWLDPDRIAGQREKIYRQAIASFNH